MSNVSDLERTNCLGLVKLL